VSSVQLAKITNNSLRIKYPALATVVVVVEVVTVVVVSVGGYDELALVVVELESCMHSALHGGVP
jgi:hypothetical protein